MVINPFLPKPDVSYDIRGKALPRHNKQVCQIGTRVDSEGSRNIHVRYSLCPARESNPGSLDLNSDGLTTITPPPPPHPTPEVAPTRNGIPPPAGKGLSVRWLAHRDNEERGAHTIRVVVSGTERQCSRESRRDFVVLLPSVHHKSCRLTHRSALSAQLESLLLWYPSR